MARIVIDPARSAGQPIVDEYEVPTIALAEAAETAGSVEGAAQLWGIPVGAVEVAVAFEQGRRFSHTSSKEEGARLIAEQMAHIRRSYDETDERASEQRRLMAEVSKLSLEQLKLQVEAAKRNRDQPFTLWRHVAGAVATGIVIVVSGILIARYVLP